MAADLRSLLGISGAMGGRDDVRVANEGAAAPELPAAVAVQVDRHHPGVLALESRVTPNNPPLRHLDLAAFWKDSNLFFPNLFAR